MILELPYPPKVLKPNGTKGIHWAVKAKAAKAYHNDCYWSAKAKPAPKFSDGDINLKITFHPKTKHKIDRDNAVSALKHGLDGLAKAWNVDDERFLVFPKVAHPIKNGKVIIEVVA